MHKVKSALIAVFIGAVSTVSVQVNAANKAPGSGPNPFLDCGIGAALFPTVGWAAVTSNVIWDIGITAITSATASPETCKGTNVKTAQFIIDNYDNLSEQTAKGQGEHLSAMLDVLGCQKDARNAIVATVRQGMSEVVGQASFADQNLVGKASDYYDVVMSAVSGAHASSCTA